MLLPCDFCDSNVAVLYCRVDLAKLCFYCDQHVHSANALSIKHVRFQICDNCKKDNATVCCSAENLILCQDCVWDTHKNCSSASLHKHTRVEGFSGCPSIIELASVLGLYLQPKDFINTNSGMQPYEQKLKNLMCGKYKNEVYEQLLEMGRRNLAKLDKDGAKFGPGTPPCKRAQMSNVESFGVSDGVCDELLKKQQTPFTSLLVLPADGDVRKNDCGSEGDLLWDCNPAYQVAQVCKL